MRENVVEAIIGAGVLAAAVLFLVFMGRTTGYATGTDSYDLIAKFRSVEGITVGSDVRLAGVKVGSVTGLTLDRETYLAETTLTVEKGVLIPDDSEAGVESEGLLGGAFINFEPGGSEFMLVAGDEVLNTQSAVSLLDLLVRFASSGGSE